MSISIAWRASGYAGVALVSAFVLGAACSGGGGGAPVAPAPVPAPEPAVAELVRDLNAQPGGAGSRPSSGVEFDDRFLLRMSTPESGAELFVTDGTRAGTRLVKDIMPGSAGSLPTDLLVAGSQVFFFAADERGRELWVTDGTTAGTRLVTETIAGATSARIRFVGSIGDVAVLAVDDPARNVGMELYSSDGQSLQFLADINPGPNSSDPGEGVAFDGRLFFAAGTAGQGRELWATDGSIAGTSQIADIHVGAADSSPSRFMVFRGDLYFAATRADVGNELFRTDGVGVDLVADIAPGPAGSNPVLLGEHGSRLILEAQDPTVGREPFRSDGTSAGTRLIQDLRPGPSDSDVELLFAIDDGLVVAADDGGSGIEPWLVRAGGVDSLGDLQPGPGSSNPAGIALTSDTGLLLLDTDAFGREPWLTDGTAAGTRLLTDIDPTRDGSGAGHSGAVAILGSLRDVAMIRANDGVVGDELWTATLATATAVDMVTSSTRSSNPAELTVAGSRLFFRAADSALGHELHVTDGSAQGTRVLDLQPGEGSSLPFRITAFGDRVLFAADSGQSGVELFISDGTPPGTRLVADLIPGAFGFSPRDFAEVGNRALFVSDRSSHRGELWSTDGTTVGTQLVRAFDGSPELTRSVLFRDRRYFLADGGATIGRELFVTDGTSNGTELFFEGVPGPAHGDPELLGVIADRLLFVIRDGNTFRELFASDGTPAGTVRVMPTPGEFLSGFTVGATSEFLLFSTIRGGGLELWRTDGSDAGTEPLARDVVTTGGGRSAAGQIWFAARSVLEGGTELWRSDGTIAGTGQAHDLLPGSRGSSPAGLVGGDGSDILFRARDLEHGNEVWRLDAAGELHVVDVFAGAADGLNGLSEIAIVEDLVLFTGDDGTTGLELYRLRLR
ncbi:MAG: hypothetical protein NXI31_01320 [bacterium]|nr:hypothetical protein [bacterium]